jgi:pimeloyl-ACP methyl ester carboxylesterase
VRTPIGRRAIPIVALLALVACGEPQPTAPQDSREIVFESTDGVRLAGRLFGPEDAKAGVVLAHMYPADQRSWFPFAERLAERGYRVLTFDFRGYCPGGDGGCSEGDKDIPSIWRDVDGATALLMNGGVQRVALIGASMGGTASLIAASEDGEGIDAIVTLSAPISFEGLEAGPDVVQQVMGAKLFLAGHADAVAAESAQQLYDESILPKRVEILTTEDHGTDILTGNQAGIASTEILNWLERYLPIGP